MPAPTAEQLRAVNRLWTHANGNSGQCRRTAAFLLGLYNGRRFPFDLTDFRTLDESLFMDCLTVLVMDNAPQKEVHDVLGVHGKQFEQLAQDWGIRDSTHPRDATGDN